MIKFRILALAALLSGALLVTAAPAAQADCVEATVRYEVLDQGEKTAWDGCVVGTPINNQDGFVGPLNVGHPSYVYVHVFIEYPLP